jgi:heme ABC exporter ATP-binding subunit CcmA
VSSSDRVVELRSVVALLGGFPALSGVDLTAQAGEIVLLEGPNGAGKTSTLRVCAGLLGVTRGTVSVAGVDVVADRRGVRRHIGLLGHAAALYDDLTVAENIDFGVRAGGGDRSRIAAAADQCGLSGRLMGQRVSSLSAGQRRRTALAICVARRPAVWLMDEPHAGLDPDGRDLFDRLAREAADAGATVLLASHDLERAEKLADRSVRIAGGAAG